jgi:hypothetical protein
LYTATFTGRAIRKIDTSGGVFAGSLSGNDGKVCEIEAVRA